jgi:hypothetical protein
MDIAANTISMLNIASHGYWCWILLVMNIDRKKTFNVYESYETLARDLKNMFELRTEREYLPM